MRAGCLMDCLGLHQDCFARSSRTYWARPPQGAHAAENGQWQAFTPLVCTRCALLCCEPVGQCSAVPVSQVQAAVLPDGVLRLAAVWCLQVVEGEALLPASFKRGLMCWLVLCDGATSGLGGVNVSSHSPSHRALRSCPVGLQLSCVCSRTLMVQCCSRDRQHC
jgi:hypothetical protein